MTVPLFYISQKRCLSIAVSFQSEYVKYLAYSIDIISSRSFHMSSLLKTCLSGFSIFPFLVTLQDPIQASRHRPMCRCCKERKGMLYCVCPSM